MTTYNLMTKFLTKKINQFHFFNLLTWHEIQTYTGGTHGQKKLIGDVITSFL